MIGTDSPHARNGAIRSESHVLLGRALAYKDMDPLEKGTQEPGTRNLVFYSDD